MIYGTRFADLWSQSDPDLVKKVWSKALAGYSAHEIRKGLDKSFTCDFVPTLPDFLKRCRSPIDPEQSYREAIDNLFKENPTWSHPAIYWTQVQIGSFDLKNSNWIAMKNRWINLLNLQLEKKTWDAIPVGNKKIMHQAQASTRSQKDLELAKKHINDIRQQLADKFRTQDAIESKKRWIESNSPK